MKTFKDFVVQDNNEVFFNTYEFAETHTVADKECSIIFSSENKGKADSKTSDDYINAESFSFYVQKTDIGFKPIIDNLISFDNQRYIVINVIENMDTFEVFLEANLR
ncbi:MAG: hypothetical protein ACK5K7_07390 [Bacilli bacterium]